MENFASVIENVSTLRHDVIVLGPERFSLNLC